MAWAVVKTSRGVRPRKTVGVGNTTKSIAHQNLLMGFLRNPGSDFTGSNRDMAKFLGISVRQVIRILHYLQDRGLIELKYFTAPSRQGLNPYFTSRWIKIQEENQCNT